MSVPVPAPPSRAMPNAWSDVRLGGSGAAPATPAPRPSTPHATIANSPARQCIRRSAQRAVEADILTRDVDIGIVEPAVAEVVIGDGASRETLTRAALGARAAEALEQPRDALGVGVQQRPA